MLRTIDDLAWLWNESAGDLGERSNHGALVSAIMMGTGESGHVALQSDHLWQAEEDDSLRSARRYRRVSRFLEHLDPKYRAVLYAFHARHRYAEELRFFELTGVVLLLHNGRVPHDRRGDSDRKHAASEAVQAALVAFHASVHGELAAA